MLYTKLTVRAMQIAYNAHDKQYDKMGVPYIFHPMHIAEQMDDEYSICVALLHDVVEDTNVTFEDLKKEFPKEVVEAVSILTRDKAISYEDYVRKVRCNELAKKVKKADLTHNSEPDRLSREYLDDETVERLKRKYGQAKLILDGHIM